MTPASQDFLSFFLVIPLTLSFSLCQLSSFSGCSDVRIINEVLAPFKSSVNANLEIKLSEIPQGSRADCGQSQKSRCVVSCSDFSTFSQPLSSVYLLLPHKLFTIIPFTIIHLLGNAVQRTQQVFNCQRSQERRSSALRGRKKIQLH